MTDRMHSSGFMAAGTGKQTLVDRNDLIQEMFEASNPNESSTALSDAREWLLDHPEDQTIISAMEDLIEVERQNLGSL